MHRVAVNPELAPFVQELQQLWEAGEQIAIKEGLARLIAGLKRELPLMTSSAPEQEADDQSDYVKSWAEILNLQVYVDTNIYGEVGSGETVIQHEQGTELYLQSWAEVAKEMGELPNNLFTKLWTTVEIAKILDCSPAMLRRARHEHRLPVKVKDFLLDCVSYDGKRSLWFVRPA